MRCPFPDGPPRGLSGCFGSDERVSRNRGGRNRLEDLRLGIFEPQCHGAAQTGIGGGGGPARYWGNFNGYDHGVSLDAGGILGPDYGWGRDRCVARCHFCSAAPRRIWRGSRPQWGF